MASPVPSSGSAPDLAVIGGGIVGLWCAHEAARRGMRVTLIEKRTIGAGASGGVLGALMPHQPTGWNAKKQFQLDGLTSLPGRIAAIEAASGLATGYARVGRLMPIDHAEKRRQAAQWAEAATTQWPDDTLWRIADANPAPGWLADDAFGHGVSHDTLSARVAPRALLGALRAVLDADPRIALHEGCATASVVAGGTVTLSDGTRLSAGGTIIAAGTGSFGLVDAERPERVGRGVKGQGALLRPARPVDPAMPILFDRGTYVIAHDDGMVAVGSTSEDAFDAPDTTDAGLDRLIEAAGRLCPALEGATVVERWAGVRPRAAGRDPLVGPLPGLAGTILATGGFKISFAIAHLMAEAAVVQALGEPPDGLPPLFLPARRLATS